MWVCCPVNCWTLSELYFVLKRIYLPGQAKKVGVDWQCNRTHQQGRGVTGTLYPGASFYQDGGCLVTCCARRQTLSLILIGWLGTEWRAWPTCRIVTVRCCISPRRPHPSGSAACSPAPTTLSLWTALWDPTDTASWSTSRYGSTESLGDFGFASLLGCSVVQLCHSTKKLFLIRIKLDTVFFARWDVYVVQCMFPGKGGRGWGWWGGWCMNSCN